MGYLTINIWSKRVVIISSVITKIFNPVQYQCGHISTYFNKDTRELQYLYCACCALCQLSIHNRSSLFLIVYRYSLFIYLCSLFIIVVHLFFPLFDFYSFCFRFCSFSILLLSLFVVHCSKEKSSVLILDSVPGISILRTTSSK